MEHGKLLAAICAVVAGLWVSAASVPAAAADPDAAARLRAAIAGDPRDANNRARDVYRHPFEALTFFGIEPDMTVVEIWPGRGWYSEILVPFLKDRGRFYAASWDRDLNNKFVQRALKGYQEKFVDHPEVYGDVIVTELSRSYTKER
jgi:predicted methyltransferase